jgi:L-threonylcarbamoyladenylate synthase
MKVIKDNLRAINEAVLILKKGGLVVFPCETVYGIACDCLNPKAVEKLNQYKERPFGKPYAIMCSSRKMAKEYVNLNETAKNLYKTFLPGPVTVVSTGLHKVAMGIESETGTLGVRIPDYKFMRDLIKKFGHSIVATSANASYQKRPYKINDILDNLSEKQKLLIDLAIDAGELPHNEPSTVIDTTLDEPTILRQGEIKLKGKNEVTSRSEENTQNIGKELWQKYERYKDKRAIVFALQGEMGAGKTIFTKGLARAMGITELVTSPTFALENEYRTGKEKLFHIDVWRLEKSDGLKALGFEDLIKNKSVVAIEWAERVADEIRKFDDEVVVVWVKIVFGKRPARNASSIADAGGDNERLISWGVEK